METQINGKPITHKFSVLRSSGFFDITSNTEFGVIINGKLGYSTANQIDDFVMGYHFYTENLPSNFEVKIYGAGNVIIDGNGEIVAEVVPDECFRLFYFSKFSSIDMSKVNPSEIRFMFADCKNLTKFKVNLNGVSDITGLFEGCVSLTSFPKIDTSNIEVMDGTWYRCESLTSFPEINTSNVKNMNSAWGKCKSLTSFPNIDISKSKKTLEKTWEGCENLKSFPKSKL